MVGSGPEHRYWPPEEREHIRDAFSKTLGGEFADIELVFMRKNGERFPVIVNPFAIRDGSGEIIYFAATVKDITRRTQMQLSLQQSERRFHSLFESAADAIIIMEGSQIVDCNEQALNLFGVYSLAQLGSRVAFDFFPPTQPNGQDSRAYSIEKLKEARKKVKEFSTDVRDEGFEAWLRRCVVAAPAPSDWTQSADLYAAYLRWIRKFGGNHGDKAISRVEVATHTRFGLLMKSMGLTKKRRPGGHYYPLKLKRKA